MAKIRTTLPKKRTKRPTCRQVDTFPCGYSCQNQYYTTKAGETKETQCKNLLKGQVKDFMTWQKVQAQKIDDINAKRRKAGLGDVVTTDALMIDRAKTKALLKGKVKGDRQSQKTGNNKSLEGTYILHRVALVPSKQEYSYGRRAQSVTYLDQRKQVAIGDFDSLKEIADSDPKSRWVIEGTANASVKGDAWKSYSDGNWQSESHLPDRRPVQTKPSTQTEPDPWDGPTTPKKPIANKTATPAPTTPKALPPAKPSKELPSVDTPIAIQELDEMAERMKTGDITVEEIQNNWERFKGSKEAIAKDLNGRYTLTQLKKAVHVPYGTKKSDYIESLVKDLEMRFNPDNSLSLGFEKGERERALEAKVKSWTPEKIQAIAAQNQANLAAEEAKSKATKKALENPETLKEFDYFARVVGEDKLSPDQLTRYDELRAAAGRETRKKQEEADRQKAAQSSSDLGGIKTNISEHFHSKLQKPLIAVTTSEMLPNDDYWKMVAVAKQYGGGKGRKWGSTPAGFHFIDADKETAIANAKKFKAELDKFLGGETVTTQGKPQAKPPETQADRLRELAASLREKATEELNRDRRTNTTKQARQAASGQESAREDIAFADTLDNLAQAIADGNIKFLDKIKNKAEVAQLLSLAKRAKWKAEREWMKQNPNVSYTKKEEQWSRPVQESDIIHAEYPYPNIWGENMPGLVREIENIKGLKIIAGRLKKHPSYGKERGVVYFDSPSQIADMRKIATIAKSLGKKAGIYMSNVLDDMRDYDRLQNMEIKNVSELRAALRELLQYQGKKGEESPIAKMERELIGVKIPGYFPTPKPLAARVAALAGIEDGDRVLEPSAGKGSLLDAVKALGKDVEMTAIERNWSLSEILKAKGYEPIHGDFLDHDGQYDKIVMNPPFENGQDMDHVQKAYDLLAPGGRLVAIMGAHGFFAGDRQSREFRDWLDDQDSTYEKLPDGSFKDSDNPTGVSTYLVEINKPGKVEKAKRAEVDSEQPSQAEADGERQQTKSVPSITGATTLQKYAKQKGLEKPFRQLGEISTVQAALMSKQASDRRLKERTEEMEAFKKQMSSVKEEFESKAIAAFESKEITLFDAYAGREKAEANEDTVWDVLSNRIQDKGVEVPSPFSLSKLERTGGMESVKSKLKETERAYFEDAKPQQTKLSGQDVFDKTIAIMFSGSKNYQDKLKSEIFGGEDPFDSPLYPDAEEGVLVARAMMRIKNGNGRDGAMELLNDSLTDRGKAKIIESLKGRYTTPTVDKVVELIKSYGELRGERSAIYGGDVSHTQGRFGNNSRQRELSEYSNAMGRIDDDIRDLFQNDWKNKQPKSDKDREADEAIAKLEALKNVAVQDSEPSKETANNIAKELNKLDSYEAVKFLRSNDDRRKENGYKTTAYLLERDQSNKVFRQPKEAIGYGENYLVVPIQTPVTKFYSVTDRDSGMAIEGMIWDENDARELATRLLKEVGDVSPNIDSTPERRNKMRQVIDDWEQEIKDRNVDSDEYNATTNADNAPKAQDGDQSSQPTNNFADDIPKETARRAYVWNSMRPDVAAEQAIGAYVETMELDLDKFKSLGAESEFANYRENYKAKYLNWLKSRHGVVSSAVSGGARFNAKKSEVASEKADSLKAELDEYRKQSLLAIEKKANPEKFAVKKGDNAELETLTKKYTALKAEIDRSELGNRLMKENKDKPKNQQIEILKTNGFSDTEIDKAFIPLGQGQFLGFAVKSKGNLRRYQKRIEELSGTIPGLTPKETAKPEQPKAQGGDRQPSQSSKPQRQELTQEQLEKTGGTRIVAMTPERYEQIKQDIKKMFGNRVSVRKYTATYARNKIAIGPTKKVNFMLSREDYDRLIQYLKDNDLTLSQSNILFQKDQDRAYLVMRSGLGYLFQYDRDQFLKNQNP